MRKRWIGAAVVAAVLGVAGCKKTFDKEVKQILKDEYGFTEEQALVGVGGALRWRFMTEKDGKFEFNYHSIPLEDQLKKLKDMRDTVRVFLDPRNEEERKYVERFKLQGRLEKQENILNYSVDRFEWVNVYSKFENAMGSRRAHSGVLSQQRMNPKGLSDLDIIFPGTDLGGLLRFSAKYVDDAKANNWMRESERFNYELKFEVEEPNPEYPQVDPNNATRWVSKRRALLIVSYDCDSNQDHQVDYVEAFRVKGDGNLEKLPALSVFKSQGSGSLDVLLLDKDAEGKKGHGIPDDVVPVQMTKGSDLYGLQDVMARLFEVPQNERREAPKEAPIQPQIVRVGDVAQKEYETNMADGWKVPLEYNHGDNYTLHVKFKEDKAPHDPKRPRAREIEYVAKRYNAPGRGDDIQGRVVEFYRVKPEYSANVRSVSADDKNRELKITFVDKPTASGTDQIFFQQTEGKIVPYRIDFDVGTKRVTIIDLDNNPAPLYEAKKEIKKPMNTEPLDEKHP